MSNEELVAAYQAGDQDALLKLWGQVRRLVMKFANKQVSMGVGRLALEDLMQAGFIAVMSAADTYDSSAAFTTWLGYYIKREFNKACGQRTEKQRREPLLNAESLDAPLTDDENSATLGDMICDPTATAALEAVEEAAVKQPLYAALREAVDALPENQKKAVKGMYWDLKRVDNKDLNDALKRLRHPRVSRKLRKYMREGS